MKDGGIIAVVVVPLIGIVYLLLKDKIEKSEQVTLRETNFLRSELAFLNQKQINLLETFLVKFSMWENRIKNVISDVSEGKDPSYSWESFEGESERLKNYLVAAIELIKRDMKKLEKDVRTSENKSLCDVTDIALNIEVQLEKNRQLIIKFYEILKSINSKSKRLESKIKKLEMRDSFGKINLR